VKALGEHSALESLLLRESRITDRCFEYLRAMPKLRRVVVEDTEVTEAGVKSFREARPDVTVVR
jgi:hypothetical protein